MMRQKYYRRTPIILLFMLFVSVSSALSDDELFAELMNANINNQPAKFSELLDTNYEQVKSAFPGWMTVPEGKRKDENYGRQHASTVVAILVYYDEKGDDTFVRMAGVPRSDNPVENWPTALSEAYRVLDADPALAIALLEPFVARFEGMYGTAVDQYMSRTLGAIGVAYFRLGDKKKSLEYLEKARTECGRIGDKDGVKVYTDYINTVQSMEMH